MFPKWDNHFSSSLVSILSAYRVAEHQKDSMGVSPPDPPSIQMFDHRWGSTAPHQILGCRGGDASFLFTFTSAASSEQSQECAPSCQTSCGGHCSPDVCQDLLEGEWSHCKRQPEPPKSMLYDAPVHDIQKGRGLGVSLTDSRSSAKDQGLEPESF